MKIEEWKNRCLSRWVCDLLPLHWFSLLQNNHKDNRAPSVTEKSGASSRQGLTLRGDELGLGDDISLSLSIYPLQYTYKYSHCCLLMKPIKIFCLTPRDPFLCGGQGTEQRSHLCSLSSLRNPILRGIQWIYLRTKENIRNCDLLHLRFLRKCENTFKTGSKVQKKTQTCPHIGKTTLFLF